LIENIAGEGHSAAGWGISGSVWLQTAESKFRSFGQWAAATCAALPCHCQSVRHFAL